MVGDLYVEYQSKTAPPSLRRENGGIVERSFGGEKDIQLDRANQALLAGIPGKGPADALPHAGSERLLPQVSGETSEDYAERLRVAWDSPGGLSRGGAHGALLRALARAGLPTGTPDGTFVIQRTKRYSYLDGDDVVFGEHNGMRWTSDPATIWHHFAILIGQDVADLTSGSELALTLNSLVRQWKPAKARYMGCYVMVQGPLWGWPPETAWGQASLKWGDGSESRFIAP